MKIALIFAPYSHRKFSENLSFVDNEFGVYPPLNLLIIASMLEKANHSVIVIDIKAQRLTYKEVLSKINDFKPDLLGYMLTTYMFNETLKWINALKSDTGIKTLVGGINMYLYAEETMAHKAIDFGIQGEAYPFLNRFIECLERSLDYSDIPGICYKKDDKIIINPSDYSVFDYNMLPFPARHLIDNSLYYSFPSRLKNFTILTTIKGCPHNCSFCAIAPLPYYERNIDLVIKELIQCKEKYDIKEIEIFDANFTANRKRTLDFCNKVIENGLDFVFACRSRIDTVDEELLDLMKKAGFERIYFGIESPSKKTLKLLNKQLDTSLIAYTLTLCNEIGIETLGFFMLGNPSERITDIFRTILYSLRLPLSYAQFCMTIPKPGSSLSEYDSEKYWKSLVNGSVDERPVKLNGRIVSRPMLIFLTYIAYFMFYLRPNIIFKRISKLRSIWELLRYIKTALKMLLGIPKSLIILISNSFFHRHTKNNTL